MGKIVIIAGPTASGKSERAVELAEQLNGVVINADSLQIYQDLKILTARPSAEDLRRAPHMLYGVLETHEQASAMGWVKMALEAIDQVRSEGRLPILCGGTGLYLKTLLEGYAGLPSHDPEIRAEVMALYDKIGHERMLEKLKDVDPDYAAHLLPNDRQRLTRSYEVFLQTGQKMSVWHKLPSVPFLDPALVDLQVLLPERRWLYERCNQRLLKMIDLGALEEVQNFMKLEVPQQSTIRKAIGLKEFELYLKGELDLETAIALAQQATRHYAKRQMTWFRNKITNNKN